MEMEMPFKQEKKIPISSWREPYFKKAKAKIQESQEELKTQEDHLLKIGTEQWY